MVVPFVMTNHMKNPPKPNGLFRLLFHRLYLFQNFTEMYSHVLSDSAHRQTEKPRTEHNLIRCGNRSFIHSFIHSLY